jgi:hypothetical protein
MARNYEVSTWKADVQVSERGDFSSHQLLLASCLYLRWFILYQVVLMLLRVIAESDSGVQPIVLASGKEEEARRQSTAVAN